MDDFVVIILTLIVAVIGLVSQARKKKNAQQKPQENNSPQNFWEAIQREMNPEPQIPEQEYVENDYEDMEEEVSVPEYKFEAREEGSSDIVQKKVVVKLPVKKPRKVAGEKFSLKKAVIYSEILNRKYF